MRCTLLVATALLGFCVCSSADAEIIVSIEGNPAFPAGGEGVVDIFVTAGTNTWLSAYSLELTIDMPYGVDSLLQFVEPPPDYENDLEYVFTGITAGPISEVPGDADRGLNWYAFDFADGPVELTSGTSYLLARLNLTHSFLDSDPPYNPAGQRFIITLVDGGNTYFLDDEGEIIPYTSAPGSVTVVPEPSGLLVFAQLLGIATMFAWRHRSKQPRCTDGWRDLAFLGVTQFSVHSASALRCHGAS